MVVAAGPDEVKQLMNQNALAFRPLRKQLTLQNHRAPSDKASRVDGDTALRIAGKKFAPVSR